MTATSKTIATKSGEDFEERKENSNKDEETQLVLEQTIFPFHYFYQQLPNLLQFHLLTISTECHG